MKFAVKTVTCLGCKTPLRGNNSVSSAYRLRRRSQYVNYLNCLGVASVDGAICDNCRPRINELYHKQVPRLPWPDLPSTNTYSGNHRFPHAGKIRKTMDAVSAMPGLSSSGKTNEEEKAHNDDRRTLGRSVHQ
jgi:hypothetical protein